jgi:hypothetical protein
MNFLREFADGISDAPHGLMDPGLYDEAYERGLADGRAQAEAEIEARTALALAMLCERLSDAQAMREEARVVAAAQAGDALTSVVRSLSPTLAAAGLAERAGHLLEHELYDVPQPVTLRAAPEVAARIADRLSLANISVDATLPETRIEIDWPDGGAILDTGEVARRILALADDLNSPDDSNEEQTHDG